MKFKIPPGYVIFTNLFRFLVGFLFLISGFIKLNDILGFAYKLEEYFQVFEAHFGYNFTALNDYAVPIAFFISIFETYLAINLLIGIYRTFTSYALLAMIVFFTFLTGYSAITHAVHDCGCFGDAFKLTPWESFVKDIVLLFMIAYIFIYKEEIKPLFKKFTINLVLNKTGLLAILFFSYYTYNHLPYIDFRPYKVGSDLKYNTTHVGDDGIPIARDYIPYQAECGFDEFQGKTLIVVIYDMKELPEEVIRKLSASEKFFKEKKIQVAIGTSALDSEVKVFKEKYKISFCIAAQDQTALKTMIRSNPGFVFMENGIIKKKWHYNDFDKMMKFLEKK